ncbi:MAG TPA: hypothetical protein VGB67_09405 [Fibrella sp.]
METPTKQMTPLEKVHRLLEVKKQVEQEAQERYRTDPEVKAIVAELKQINAKRFAPK